MKSWQFGVQSKYVQASDNAQVIYPSPVPRKEIAHLKDSISERYFTFAGKTGFAGRGSPQRCQCKLDRDNPRML